MVKMKSKSCPAVMKSKNDSSGSSNISAMKVQRIRGKLMTIMKSAVKEKKAKKFDVSHRHVVRIILQ